MQKTLQLALNKFETIPNGLRENPSANAPVDEITVDLARLYHHFYLDTRGFTPPNPDPAQFDHLSLLLPQTEFRVRGEGFGLGGSFRKHVSNELGQAFCRWFLYEHVNVTYFAHMGSVLGRSTHAAFGGITVQRVKNGDTPDYFCAEHSNKVFLAEAKGRATPISFANAEFMKWRKQFETVVVKGPDGVPRSVKGFIVGTRFAAETMSASVKSKLYAEDPESFGREPLFEQRGLGNAIVSLHYSDIAAKLRQPVLAAALATGLQVPPEIQFPAIVWEIQLGPLQKIRFVGGYFPGPGVAPSRIENGRLIWEPSDPLRLDLSGGTFVGVEEKTFASMCQMTRSSEVRSVLIEPLQDVVPFYSGISFLRDGSLIAPLEFMRPVGRVTF